MNIKPSWSDVDREGCSHGVGTLDPETYVSSLMIAYSILDTVSMILIMVGGYEYIVVDFGNPLAYLNIPP